MFMSCCVGYGLNTSAAINFFAEVVQERCHLHLAGNQINKNAQHYCR